MASDELGGEYKRTKVIGLPRVFTLTLTVFEMLRFEMYDLENLDQGRRVEHSQRCHFIANTLLPN